MLPSTNLLGRRLEDLCRRSKEGEFGALRLLRSGGRAEDTLLGLALGRGQSLLRCLFPEYDSPSAVLAFSFSSWSGCVEKRSLNNLFVPALGVKSSLWGWVSSNEDRALERDRSLVCGIMSVNAGREAQPQTRSVRDDDGSLQPWHRYYSERLMFIRSSAFMHTKS